MMNYATVNEFILSFGEDEAIALTNPSDPAAQNVAQDVLNNALDNAKAEIDAYISTRYSLPLASVPPILQVHCLSITRYRLSIIEPGEDVIRRYNQAIAFLRDIAAGKSSLGLAQDSEAESSDSPAYKTRSGSFTRENLAGY